MKPVLVSNPITYCIVISTNWDIAKKKNLTGSFLIPWVEVFFHIVILFLLPGGNIARRRNRVSTERTAETYFEDLRLATGGK